MTEETITATFESRVLDTITENLENVLGYYDEGRVSAEETVVIVRDLLTIVRNTRSVKFTIGENDGE